MNPGPRLRAIGLWLIAFSSLTSGAALAWVHPLSPVLAIAVFYAVLVLLVFKPGLWLFLVPASLPVLNFFPWTGWRMVEEFDLLLLATFAAGYGRLGWIAWQRAKFSESKGYLDQHGRLLSAIESDANRTTQDRPAPTVFTVPIILFTVFSVASAFRGFSADGFLQAVAGWRQMGLFQDYVDPLNSLRQLKSLAFAVLCLPLLRREFVDLGLDGSGLENGGQSAFARLGAGLLAGLTLVVLAGLWERLAYPGWLNFSTTYRTTATFWEMHVGGGTIDAYLVLCAPFVVWALARAGRLRHWLPLGFLALLTGYVVLTTFSRGVYAAVVLPLLLLWLFWGLLQWARRTGLNLGQPVEQMWRKRASVGLGLALVAEVALVTAGGSFLMDRLGESKNDLDDRLTHWQRGVGLLQSPLDWLIGRGLGRFTVAYAALGPESEFSGALRLLQETPATTQFQAVPVPLLTQNFIRLSGPTSQGGLGGLFMLNQRVNVPVAELVNQGQARGQDNALRPGESKESARAMRRGVPDASQVVRVNLDVRSSAPAQIMLKICEKHLLYEGECLVRSVRLGAVDDGWQSINLVMRGDGFRTAGGVGHRQAVMTMTVFTPGAKVDLRNFSLFDSAGRPLIANADFSQGLSRWFPSASSYYLPWHIDNLYLELLIERGLAGLLLFFGMVIYAFRRLVSNQKADSGLLQNDGTIVGLALLGILLLGLVSSVLDAPRVAFLLFLLIFLPIGPGDGKSAS